MHFHQGQYNLYHYLSLVLWKSYLRISSKPKQCPPISAHTFAKQKTKCFYGYKTRQWTPVALWASMLFRLKNIEIDWKIPWLYKSCLSESSMVSPWKKIAVLWTRTKMECLRNSWTYGHTHWTFLRPQLFISVHVARGEIGNGMTHGTTAFTVLLCHFSSQVVPVCISFPWKMSKNS